MKKVVFASLLAVGVMSATTVLRAQDSTPQAAADGQVQMPAAEANAYNNAISQTDAKAKAAALEAYLQQYPQSQVKAAVLLQLMSAYSTFDQPKTLDAADRLLQVDPNNIRALAIESGLLKGQADTQTDASQKQTTLDKAAGFAQRGLKATKPATISDADWQAVQKQVTPYFYSAIGAAALTKKDSAGAISAYESELKSVPVEQTQQPGQILADTFALATAYYQSTPPDYVKCTFFATRTAIFAPDQFKPTFQPLASYCYKKYHGGDDGYDAVKTAAQANLFPPADFTIKAAPTPADYVKTVLTGDVTSLALSDREFVIQYGTPEQADQVFAPIKGKEVKVTGVVVSSSGTNIQLSVSDDSKAAKTADFSIDLKEAPKTAPTVGATIDVVATFDSYTQKPVVIKMTGGELPAAKKAAPTHKPVTHHK